MPWGFFGNLIFAIIARMLYGNHLNVERSGNQCVAMVTELLSSYWRVHVAEAYCKESNISDTNWLRYLFSSYVNKIWLSVWRHRLANLHILKTSISLDRKEIFENSKQHFSSHAVRLLMFQNSSDRKDAVFVIVPLWEMEFVSCILLGIKASSVFPI